MHPAPWPIDDIITGERLQAVADAVLATPEKLAAHQSLPDAERARACLFRVHPEGRLDIGADDLERLKRSRVLFVYGDFVELFFLVLLPVMEQPFVLVSHNADNLVDHRFREFLAHPRLIRWYAQNVSPAFVHPKIVSLPIGVANAQWPHGDLAGFHRIAGETPTRDIILYANFAPDTASVLRKGVIGGLAGNPAVVWEERAPVDRYWRALRRSRFVAAPRGNGLDTHRLWEALYLGAVPVVDAEDRPACCEGLPVLTTKNWATLDAATLNAHWDRLPPSAFAHQALSLAHWRNRIRADAGLAVRQAPAQPG